jgi:hypothetical protein
VDTNLEFERSMLRDMRKVIQEGTLEELKIYFIDSPLTKNDIYSDLEYNIKEAFLSSCYYGKLDFVQYLLTSPELSTNANIHYREDSAIFNAIDGFQTDIIEYLLHSSDLKEHIDLYKNIDDVFDNLMLEIYTQDKNSTPGDASAISLNKVVIDMIDYLIYDYGISPTNNIIDSLIENTKRDYYEPAIKKLNTNLLYNSLIENTNINDIKIKKNKI